MRERCGPNGVPSFVLLTGGNIRVASVQEAPDCQLCEHTYFEQANSIWIVAHIQSYACLGCHGRGFYQLWCSRG